MSENTFASKYYSPDDPVAVVPLREYTPESARRALEALLSPLGGLSFVEAGMTVVIKANLVSAMKPEAAGTTHPTLLSALCDMLAERGAKVIVGDSPGGIYTPAFVGRVYSVTGLHEVEKHGASLNDDYSQHTASFAEGKVLHDFTYTGYLDKADLIINFAKLKSHGMMGMSCAAKNIFGVIPGIIKPEYHFRFSRYEDFADMIVDLDEYFHPVLSIADGIVGMEGNGPTAGTPKAINCLIASHSPHNLDMIASKILGFEKEELPILNAAYLRGMTPENADAVKLFGNIDALILPDFERVVERRSLQFGGDGKNPAKRFFSRIAGAVLRTKPVVKLDECVGCGVCADVCPAKTIVINKKKKAVIKRSACIRCFCCQEFCPKSAMKVHRSFIAELFHREKKK